MTASQMDAFCTRYAALSQEERVMKYQEEWDFRDIEDSEVEAAIDYEYARENDDVWRIAVSTLQTVVHGKTIRLHLIEGNDHAVDECLEGKDGSLGLMMAWRHETFPLPWAAFEKEDRLQDVPNPTYLRVVSMSEPAIQGLISGMARHNSFHGYWMDLDLKKRPTKKAVVAAFKKWLDAEYEGHEKSKKAKAASPPRHLLRYLGAYRLNRAGYDFKSARTLVMGITGKRDRHDHNVRDLDLPLFGSSGEWTHALNKAKRELAARAKKAT